MKNKFEFFQKFCIFMERSKENFRVSHSHKTNSKQVLKQVIKGTHRNGIPSLFQETTGACDLWMTLVLLVVALERLCGTGLDSFCAGKYIVTVAVPCHVSLGDDVLPMMTHCLFERLFT